MKFTHNPIPVDDLKAISVLYRGDLYEVAILLLKIITE